MGDVHRYAPPVRDGRDQTATTPCRKVEKMQDTAATTTSGRWVLVGLACLVAAFVAYVALGMPGMDHSDGEMRDTEHPSGQSIVGAER
jgi:hypothetical protein